MNQILVYMCNVKGVAHSDELTGNYQPMLHSPQLYGKFNIFQLIVLVLLFRLNLTT